VQEVYCKKKNLKKRRWWVKPWVSRRKVMGISSNLLREWATEEEYMMKNHLRMSEAKLEELLSKVTPLNENHEREHTRKN